MKIITLDGAMSRLRWFHGVVLLAYIASNAWLASPYFFYYVVGAPDPNSAPRYRGKFLEKKIEKSQDGKWGEVYIFNSEQGKIRMFCGYRPLPDGCNFGLMMYTQRMDDVFEIGFDDYYGISYVDHPKERIEQARWDGFNLVKLSSREQILKDRVANLRRHRKSLYIFLILAVVYLLLLLNGVRRARSSARA